MNLGREFVDERVLRDHVEDGTIPLPPHFKLISRGERLRRKTIRCHLPPGTYARHGSRRGEPRYPAPGLAIDTDKVRFLSSHFCLITYRQTPDSVDWDVEHSPGTASPRQIYESQLGYSK
jgi:hypothetical protein